MSDWADEEAEQLRTMLGDILIKRTSLPSIASALRAAELRGRVAGLKRAAEMVTEDYQLMCMDHRVLLVSRATMIILEAAHAEESAADRIEKGETHD
jgi:hypothetical protein